MFLMTTQRCDHVTGFKSATGMDCDSDGMNCVFYFPADDAEIRR